MNQSLLAVTRSPLNSADHADRLVLAVALRHRVDAERMRVGGQRAGAGTEDGAAAGHVVELHHALRDVVGMVIGQRHHAGAELDPLGALARRRQEHLGRGDHLPAGGMMLAAPELVIAERVELLDQIEIAPELKHRMLPDRVMRGKEGSEFQARHGGFSGCHFLFVERRGYVLETANAIARCPALRNAGMRVFFLSSQSHPVSFAIESVQSARAGLVVPRAVCGVDHDLDRIPA